MSARRTYRYVFWEAMASVLLLAACGQAPSEASMQDDSIDNPLRTIRPTLGVGVDFAETKSYRRCVTTPSSEVKHPFSKRLYMEKAVRSRTELNESLNVDASIGAKGMWGGASASFSYFKDVKMNSESFYWLVYADYRLTDDGIDLGSPDFKLTNEAIAILNGPRGLQGFHEACGDYFYSGRTLGSKYALLYEFKTQEEKALTKLKTSASYGGFGVEAKASFERMTAMAQKASVLDIHVDSTGGGDRLSSCATNPELLEGELKTLRDDLYNHGLGVATEWFVSDYNMFPEVQEAKARDEAIHSGTAASAPDLLVKETSLSTLYRLYHRNIDYHERLMALLANATSSEPLYAYEPHTLVQMRQRLETLEDGGVTIAQAARRCIVGEAEDCKTGSLSSQFSFTAGDLRRDFPPREDYTGLGGWDITLLRDKYSDEHLNFFGEGPLIGGRRIATAFNTYWKVGENYAGVYAPADIAIQNSEIIGRSEIVRDPVSGQMRPYICIYEFSERCSLRAVPLAVSSPGPQHIKLQLVLYDEFGLVKQKMDFPATN